MRAAIAAGGLIGVLALTGCGAGVAGRSAAAPVVTAKVARSMATPVSTQRPTAVHATPAKAVGGAKAAAVLQSADDHERGVLASGQRMGNDPGSLLAWAKPDMDWEQQVAGGVYGQAQHALWDAGITSTTGLDAWNSHFMDGSLAVLQYITDRLSGASAAALTDDAARATRALDQADQAVRAVAATR
ncbi:hypothetical protein [Streptacidiphilus rugosus]|uniref:hypothetical protein n=1 Tax=Streptacidiphilus rugosus TaxID=405783 RepID=UPI00056549BC|nr:hypothetical protein [Streptacidiphilus rugosus]